MTTTPEQQQQQQRGFPAQKPSIGRIVHLVGPIDDASDAEATSAIITRVHGERDGYMIINVIAFVDGGEGAVALRDIVFADVNSREAAEEVRQEAPATSAVTVAYWPPRVA